MVTAPTTLARELACACGDRRLRVRLARNDGAGLVTCARGDHASLLFDSRDVWDDVIQERRPPEVRCRCKGNTFHASARYQLRAPGGDVRAIAFTLRCAACGNEARGMEIEVDYSPTDQLLQRPLDPCPQPWLKAKRIELTGYWRRADAGEVAAHLVEHEGAHAWLSHGGERPRRATVAALRAAIGKEKPYDIYFAPDDRALLFPPHDPWRRLPIIHLDSPTSMTHERGTGHLYYLRWATQLIIDGEPVPHDTSVLALGSRLRRFLDARFVSRRGRDCRDSPEELHRLRLP